MDNYYMYGFPYDPTSPYGVMNYYDPNETKEERERNAFVGLLCVVVCFIGFPLAVAIGYGLYRLFGLFGYSDLSRGLLLSPFFICGNLLVGFIYY